MAVPVPLLGGRIEIQNLDGEVASYCSTVPPLGSLASL
jgi:hypothetical protein